MQSLRAPARQSRRFIARRLPRRFAPRNDMQGFINKPRGMGVPPMISTQVGRHTLYHRNFTTIGLSATKGARDVRAGTAPAEYYDLTPQPQITVKTSGATLLPDTHKKTKIPLAQISLPVYIPHNTSPPVYDKYTRRRVIVFPDCDSVAYAEENGKPNSMSFPFHITVVRLSLFHNHQFLTGAKLSGGHSGEIHAAGDCCAGFVLAVPTHSV